MVRCCADPWLRRSTHFAGPEVPFAGGGGRADIEVGLVHDAIASRTQARPAALVRDATRGRRRSRRLREKRAAPAAKPDLLGARADRYNRPRSAAPRPLTRPCRAANE